jgi:3-oxoacyl-[acyl-carrier protein] reductase
MSWALITGGAKRLGRTLALELAKRGHCVAVHYRKSCSEAENVVAECQQFGNQAVAIQGDFTSQRGVEEFLKRYQKQCSETSLLIHNVGNYYIGSLAKTSAEEWRALFQTNFHAAVQITQTLTDSLSEQKGAILAIGCSGLEGRASKQSPAYRSSKIALLYYVRALASELAEKGVSVNMVSPGRLLNSVDLTEERIHAIPMGRPGELEEVARAVLFLADPTNRYITGQNLEVAGGLGV